MDQSALVNSGQALVRELDAAGLKSRFAMWVHNTDIDTWKLWIVPPKEMKDRHHLYRRISEIVSKHRSEVGGLNASDIEIVFDTHPAIEGLKSFIRAPGLGSIHFSGNMFNNFYLPDGIILRSDL